jgi:perosamine synthetase
MNFIPLASPDIRDEDIQSVVSVLKSGQLVQNINVEKLERDISEFLMVSNTIAVSSGTATMHLVLKALGVGPGDEIIVPAFSYVATANVVELVGAKPVFVDIDLDTFNIDIRLIEKAITPNTKGIIPVHEFGLACDINSLMQIAEKHNIFVLEDAACALGAKQNNKFVGTFGIAGSFSLHPRKAITSGEGGLVTTNSNVLANKIMSLRNHGIEIINDKMEFVEAGFNYRMTDFQAALVLSQLKRFNNTLHKKQELAEVYFEEIINNKIKLPVIPKDRNHTWQTFHVIVDSSLNRDQIIQTLKGKGIGTNYGAQCIPQQLFYKIKYELDCEKWFPNSMLAYKQGLALPIYEKLSKEEIKFISKEIKKLK